MTILQNGWNLQPTLESTFFFLIYHPFNFLYTKPLYFSCDTGDDTFEIVLDMDGKSMEARGVIYDGITVSPSMIIGKTDRFSQSIQLSRKDLSVVRRAVLPGILMPKEWKGKCVKSEKKQTENLF